MAALWATYSETLLGVINASLRGQDAPIATLATSRPRSVDHSRSPLTRDRDTKHLRGKAKCHKTPQPLFLFVLRPFTFVKNAKAYPDN